VGKLQGLSIASTGARLSAVPIKTVMAARLHPTIESGHPSRRLRDSKQADPHLLPHHPIRFVRISRGVSPDQRLNARENAPIS